MASKALLVVAALTALAWPPGGAAQGVMATVLSIGDGDTIRVRQAGKAVTVRLACIDAPKTAQSFYGQQPALICSNTSPSARPVFTAIEWSGAIIGRLGNIRPPRAELGRPSDSPPPQGCGQPGCQRESVPRLPSVQC